MGEVVVNSEGKKEFDVPAGGIVRPVERVSGKVAAAGGGGSGAAEAAGGDSSVSWERFLPKMVVRVLLVEADDSTRQIIAALLRKCSYRVAAVPDGLKAWELLKGRPHNIDLILTEVELPSISGYALLTLIMEHEVCKNIPVIMMSSQDSVSTVYKCMLRGAADFLVKPVRKNELRNLWQHVWRKQVSITGAGLGPPFEGVAREKDEATAENNESSNHSSGCKSSIQRNKECVGKGSDAQSSCTKPESGNEKGDTDHNQCISSPKSDRCPGDEVQIPAKEECHQESRKTRAQDMEKGELQPVQKMLSNAASDVEHTQERVNIMADKKDILENSSGAAIDLIGSFDNRLVGTFGSPDSNAGTNKYEVLPLLDLSLRRSHPSGFAQVHNDEMHKLNHSNASPFSRYINKSLQLCTSTSPSPCNQPKDHGTNHADRQGPAICTPKQISVASIQEGKQENAFSCSQSRETSQPIAVKGVRLENFTNDYCSAVPSVYCAQQGSSPLPSLGTAHQPESSPQVKTQCPSDNQPSTSQQYQSLLDNKSVNNSTEQTDSKHGKKLENVEDQGNVSAANDQSTNSSFCNGNRSRINREGSGNINGNITKALAGCANEEAFHVQDGPSHRSIQREAALTKFRLKRKDRCFEKKVRYESRKKLAEKRPRVKGQFVRQSPYETQPGSSYAS